nr:hypothetical protein K-LCC10_0109 [Kaumoebavirus]
MSQQDIDTVYKAGTLTLIHMHECLNAPNLTEETRAIIRSSIAFVEKTLTSSLQKLADQADTSPKSDPRPKPPAAVVEVEVERRVKRKVSSRYFDEEEEEEVNPYYKYQSYQKHLHY